MKRRRFYSAAAIEKAIDRAKVRALNNGKRAETADSILMTMIKTGAKQHEIDMQRREVERLWKYAKNIQDQEIPRLSKKLAAFRTETMFGMEKDIPR